MSATSAVTKPLKTNGLGRTAKPRKPTPGVSDSSAIGRNKWLPYLFSAPSIIFVSVILAYPVVWGIVQSLFRREKLASPLEFVGFENYLVLFSKPTFWDSLSKTGIFVFGCLILGTALGLIFAFALNRTLGALRFLRAVTIAPYIVSSVAAAVMFRIFFNGDFGTLNRVIQFFGFDGLPWLSNTTLAMIVVIVAQVWTDLPLTILLVLAGLQAIDKSYLEAALVDGASSFQRARLITLPLLSPQIAMSIIWQSYSTLTGIGVVLALTGGGPLRATQILPIEMYNTAFVSLQQNEALAIGTIILILNSLLTLIYLRLSSGYGVED
ncbi:MAG: binding-protein-dependent transport system inner rane component [Rhodoglobus sp.]|nr:binding-protein-dependent transport system inner rane component [Rhodoglobus sp.]